MLKTLYELIPDVMIVVLSGTLILYLYSEPIEVINSKSVNNIEIKIIKPSETREKIKTDIDTDDWWPFIDEDIEEYTEWTRR
tara:strand:+ start:113 stop:358 length:246 start_codon:yes stop_codon:yes gene_type:complete